MNEMARNFVVATLTQWALTMKSLEQVTSVPLVGACAKLTTEMSKAKIMYGPQMSADVQKRLDKWISDVQSLDRKRIAVARVDMEAALKTMKEIK